MSSSTSSSERAIAVVAPAAPAGPRRRRAWLWPLAVVLLVMAALEGFARVVLVPASRDLQSCAGYAGDARALFARPGPRLVVVGNSATRKGVDGALLGTLMHADVAVFSADSAKVTTMYWMVTHDLWAQGLRPRWVVLPYFGDQLADGEDVDVGRLARYFSGPRDWPELFRYDLLGLDQRAELVASSLSAAFATRRRIKRRVLEQLPGYQDGYLLTERVLVAHGRAGGRRAPTFDTLRRFVARAQASGTRLGFVAFPSQEGTDAPAEALRILDDAGMRLVDLRHVAGLGPQHYEDFVHLNPTGQALFTRALARALDGIVP
jgi:hypothetical protein